MTTTATTTTQRFQPYPYYKPSGVEWLGHVPEHWEVRKLKHIADVRNSNVDKKTAEDEDAVRLCNYVDVYYNDYITDDINFMAASASSDKIKRFSLQPGDVIVTKDSEAWDDIAVPACVDQEFDDVLCGYHLALIRPHAGQSDGEYLFRAFLSHAIRDQFRVRANGVTRFGIPRDGLTSAMFPVPPFAEQQSIAAFLRRETGKIDSLIDKKRRLIELLKEKRTALISHAVTKGLNPNARMKPSGIDWLGDVPEHWEVPPFYSRYRVELGKMLDEKKITRSHLVPYLRNIDVQWDSINTDDLPEMDIEERQYERFTLTHGDLVVCEGGEVGRAAFWQGQLPRCGFQKALHRLRPRDPERDNPRFLFYIMHTGAHGNVFVSGGNPNTIPHLTGEKLRVYRFPFPPRPEQDEIAARLDSESRRLNNSTALADAAITHLTEYRSALISAAVTGKIDVRSSAVAPAITTIDSVASGTAAAVLDAEIVARFNAEGTLRRTKRHKATCLCHYHAELDELNADFVRDAAGPRDLDLIERANGVAQERGWFEETGSTDEGYSYHELDHAGHHRHTFDSLYGTRMQRIDEVLIFMQHKSREQCESYATLYCAWNDLLILGLEPSHDAILEEVLVRWHPKKAERSLLAWQSDLRKLEKSPLIPRGFGKPTRQPDLFT